MFRRVVDYSVRSPNVSSPSQHEGEDGLGAHAHAATDSHAHASAHGHAHGSNHGHAHGNSHGHAHGMIGPTNASVRRALGVALILNGAFLVVELAIGLWTGSLALLSDAAHMVSDVAALTLALGASSLAHRLTRSERTFGMVRAEALGAFVNALALIVTCGFIFKEAIVRLLGEAPNIAGWPVLIAGVLGLAINLGSAWFLARADRENLNVRGALLHMLSDALGSAGAIIAAGLVMLGFPAADAVVSVFIGLLVLVGTWGLLRESAAVLLEFSPRGLSVVDVQKQLLSLSNAASVHDLHIWSLDGKTPILSAHLVRKPDASPDLLLRQAEDLLGRRFGITHCTLQIETSSGDPCRAQASCSLLPRVTDNEQSSAESRH